MSTLPLKQIIEGAILAADGPLSIDHMIGLFVEEQPTRAELQQVLDNISDSCIDRGFELKKVAGGYRFQIRLEYGEWISRLWDEKPPRYSRALLETLALIAYRQPVTRGDIEEVRGVSVSTNIIRTLLEREWIRVVGHRDVPGRPAMYATTKTFLDYFNMNSLDELPTLAEIRDLDEVNRQLELEEPVEGARVIELEDMANPGPALVSDDELDEVTGKVIAISDNIRKLFDDEYHAGSNNEQDEDHSAESKNEQLDDDRNAESKNEQLDDEHNAESKNQQLAGDHSAAGRSEQFANVPIEILNAAFAEEDDPELSEPGIKRPQNDNTDQEDPGGER